jgi:16S rRNA pseudouridine516 synthase
MTVGEAFNQRERSKQSDEGDESSECGGGAAARFLGGAILFAPFAPFCGHYRAMRRIDQLLSSLGYCSRREARAWLAAGRVTVRGVVADDPGAKAKPEDVRIDGEPPDHPDGLLLMFHKPVGLVCSHDPGEGPRVYDMLPARWLARHPPVTSIGRLDKETSGLLLLTDQTALVHRLTSPKHKVPKVYRATVDRDLAPDLIPLFAAGTLVLNGETAPCASAGLSILAPREAELTLTEGRYHQARRMFAAVGATVLTLHRTRFGTLDLGGLAAGEWRELPPDFSV